MNNVFPIHRRKLKIVVLEAPYDSLKEKHAPDIFGKIISLKLQGYGPEYPYGTMPVDTNDFIATHLAVCVEDGSELKPIMAYKTVQQRKCRAHGVQFPGQYLPKISGAEMDLAITASRTFGVMDPTPSAE